MEVTICGTNATAIPVTTPAPWMKPGVMRSSRA